MAFYLMVFSLYTSSIILHNLGALVHVPMLVFEHEFASHSVCVTILKVNFVV